MFLSEEQYAKAPAPILVTLLGITISVNEEQPKKAPFTIHVTLSGITTVVKSLQSKNALKGISVIPSGMMATPSLISNCVIHAVRLAGLFCCKKSILIFNFAFHASDKVEGIELSIKSDVLKSHYRICFSLKNHIIGYKGTEKTYTCKKILFLLP